VAKAPRIPRDNHHREALPTNKSAPHSLADDTDLMSHSTWNTIAFWLVLVPAAALGLTMSGLVSIGGGHGLSEWLFDSVCFALTLIGTLLNGMLVLRARDRRSWPGVMALLGCAVLTLFLARFGPPFGR
jgi:hypothetical protein